VRIVLALGGNALLRRGEALSADNLLNNIKHAARQIIKLVPGNELIITHGNGPQVGLLALQNNAYKQVKPYPLDILGAETQGMIGYLIQQEIANLLGSSRMVTTLLTRVEVDQNDPAFFHPTKPIGPVYSKSEVELLALDKQWTIMPEGNGYRRVVASPLPKCILSIDPIRWMVERDAIVIACGGGGIPVIATENKFEFRGVEAVIDKDLCSALLAGQLSADCLIIATDVDAVYLDWGMSTQRPIREISFAALRSMNFLEGSMAPKVLAVCNYVEKTKKTAFIGSLNHIDDILNGVAGTRIT
jgi:carbamate kinase